MGCVVQGIDHAACSIGWAECPFCRPLSAVPYPEIAALLFDQDADNVLIEVQTASPQAICAGERFSARRGSAAPALCESRAPSVLRPRESRAPSVLRPRRD